MPIKSRKTAKKPPPSAGKAAAAPRRGRPTVEAELEKRVGSAGVDPDSVDPRRILAAIAIDAEAPAGARVAAAKALLIAGGKIPAGVGADDDPELDQLSRRALAIMSKGKPN